MWEKLHGTFGFSLLHAHSGARWTCGRMVVCLWVKAGDTGGSRHVWT